MRTNKSLIIAIGAALCLTLGARDSQAGDLYGKPIPEKVPVVKYADILKDPAQYKDKEVVVEGNYGGHCCATDFIYKEGLNGTECYYPGFSVPKGKAGRPVKIHAIVRVRGEEKAESEKGEKGESEKKETKEVQVYLEAKGVQFK